MITTTRSIPAQRGTDAHAPIFGVRRTSTVNGKNLLRRVGGCPNAVSFALESAREALEAEVTDTFDVVEIKNGKVTVVASVSTEGTPHMIWTR